MATKTTKNQGQDWLVAELSKGNAAIASAAKKKPTKRPGAGKKK